MTEESNINNNNMSMNTPPSSPPPFQKMDKPTTLTGTGNEATLSSPARGHTRSTTPSTPIQEAGVIGMSQLFSTPGRSDGSNPPFPARASSTGNNVRVLHKRQGSVDLTPVISNSNAIYVDATRSGNKPGMAALNGMSEEEDGQLQQQLSSSSRGLRQRRSRMPLPRAGLPPAKRSSIEDSEVAVASIGGAGVRAILRMSSNASDSSLQGVASLSARGSMDNNDNSGNNLLGERLSMPSYGSLCSDELDVSSVDTSNDSEDRIVGIRSSNNNFQDAFATPSKASAGAGSGARASSIFKEKNNNNKPPSLNLGLAPIELKPDRKFFSFQGSSQYKRAVRSNDEESPPATRRLETIPSPSRRPPASPARTVGGAVVASSPVREGHQQPMLSSLGQRNHMNIGGQNMQMQRQYQPSLRSQHGVQEMADTKDLDAIFKAPRNTIDGRHIQKDMPKVVSPYNQPSSLATVVGGEGMAMTVEGLVSPMSIDLQQTQQLRPQPLPSYPPREDDEDDSEEHLRMAYPVESQWSIPSIRLANHVHQNSSRHGNGQVGSGGYPLVAGNSYLSEYTYGTYDDDGASLDESYYTFGDDDDAASLSSRGSVDASVRRRRWKEHGRRISVEAGAGNENAVANNAVPQTILRTATSNSDAADNVNVPPVTPTAIAQSKSFLEKIQNISFEDRHADAAGTNDGDIFLPPPLPRRAETFDYENEPPPILSINATSRDTVDDDMVDYYQSRPQSSGRRRHKGRGSRRKRKEGAAVEWLQELQNASKSGGTSDGNAVLITEAASSKFLGGGIVDGGSRGGALPVVQLGRGMSSGVVGLHNGGQQFNIPASSGMTPEDMTKVLGMPHPLCRSSTIEAGPFVHRNRDVNVVLGNNNSIALTSSGSGD